MNIFILIALVFVTLLVYVIGIKKRLSKVTSSRRGLYLRIYKYVMITMFVAIALFTILTINDGFHDNIPITIRNNEIGLVNNSIYSENYGGYEKVIEYPVYQLTFTGSSVLFKVTNDNKFVEYLGSQDSYVAEYQINDLTIYMLNINDSIYYLTKTKGVEKYSLFPSYTRVNNETNIPIVPCEFFSLGTYSNHILGEFHSTTSLTWEEVANFYSTYYPDYITMDYNQKQITISAELNQKYIISYDNMLLDIGLLE